ncbi:MAG TPA: hypothetical protein VKE94_00545 [Gemmataceae bacterium]|nr:hypothetical protein [Gemmataceae bacterium]
MASATVALWQATPALAWKPKTHVYLAEIAYKDAVDDGFFTIYETDYQAGTVKRNSDGSPVVIGKYPVNPAVLAALRSNPAHFRAGVLGPDAYPDIATGQQIIHPAGKKGNGETEVDLNRGGPGPDEWLRHLWNLAYAPGKEGQRRNPEDSSPACRAFVIGYLTHAAGDIYGHTLINHYTGDAFHFSPTPENAIKHIVLEGYVGLKTPEPTYDARIDQGVDQFIWRNMVFSSFGTFLPRELLSGENAKYSVPAIFSELYRSMVAEVRRYDQTTNLDPFKAIEIAYKREWLKDIDEGLRAWPELSHQIALALFFNPQGKADLDRVKVLIDDYTNRHLLSMLGAPDFVGAIRAIVGAWIDAALNAIQIPAIRQAIDAIKTSLYEFVLKSTFGMTTEELKRYLTSPETIFDSVMMGARFFTEGGNQISRAEFDRKELRLSGPTFDYMDVPAAYNTVMLTKLLMMEPGTVKDLIGKLAPAGSLSPKQLDRMDPNAALGFIGTLDGSNQWSVNPSKMVMAIVPAAYRRIFMRQSGERP